MKTRIPLSTMIRFFLMLVIASIASGQEPPITDRPLTAFDYSNLTTTQRTYVDNIRAMSTTDSLYVVRGNGLEGALLASAGIRIVFDYFPGLEFNAQQTNLEIIGPDEFVWTAKPVESRNSGDYIIMSWYEGDMSGLIAHNANLYQISSLGMDAFAVYRHNGLPDGYCAGASRVNISIFNLQGESIMTWNYRADPGHNQILWEGLNRQGAAMPSGIYLYRLAAYPRDGSPAYHSVKKMVLLR